MQTNRLRAIITGVGAYYPDYILDNEELSQMVDTSDEFVDLCHSDTGYAFPC